MEDATAAETHLNHGVAIFEHSVALGPCVHLQNTFLKLLQFCSDLPLLQPVQDISAAQVKDRVSISAKAIICKALLASLIADYQADSATGQHECNKNLLEVACAHPCMNRLRNDQQENPPAQRPGTQIWQSRLSASICLGYVLQCILMPEEL